MTSIVVAGQTYYSKQPDLADLKTVFSPITPLSPYNSTIVADKQSSQTSINGMPLIPSASIPVPVQPDPVAVNNTPPVQPDPKPVFQTPPSSNPDPDPVPGYFMSPAQSAAFDEMLKYKQNKVDKLKKKLTNVRAENAMLKIEQQALCEALKAQNATIAQLNQQILQNQEESNRQMTLFTNSVANLNARVATMQKEIDDSKLAAKIAIGVGATALAVGIVVGTVGLAPIGAALAKGGQMVYEGVKGLQSADAVVCIRV